MNKVTIVLGGLFVINIILLIDIELVLSGIKDDIYDVYDKSNHIESEIDDVKDKIDACYSVNCDTYNKVKYLY